MYRRFCLLFLIFIFISFSVSCVAPIAFDATGAEFGIMEVFVFGFENADAILITTDNHTVMIDTGEEQHGSEIVAHLNRNGITSIDYLIITHFDRDHVGGAAEVIQTIEVQEVVVPHYLRESRHYLRFVQAMQESGIHPIVLTSSTRLEFMLDGVMFTTYASDLDFYEYIISEDYSHLPNVNNFSLVTTINHGNNHFLFTGDAMARRLREILSTESIMTNNFDFLKVPHHGRYNRRSIEFINRIRPRYAAITCSFDRPAAAEVVEALEAVGSEIFFVKNGSVLIRSDGNKLIVSQ